MQRYFVDKNNDGFIFLDSDIHHISHVLRMKLNDHIEVVNDGHLFECEIVSFNPFNVRVTKELEVKTEFNKDLVLFMALAKGDKLELVIQKATELGASKVVLIKSKRCVCNFDNKDFNRKLDRYLKIAKEASEQSKRTRIPAIEGVFDIKNIPDSLLCDINFVAYEKRSEDEYVLPSLKDKSVSILIGPEGGLEKEEVEHLVNRGFKEISLGQRILRCETAAISALSVLGYLMDK